MDSTTWSIRRHIAPALTTSLVFLGGVFAYEGHTTRTTHQPTPENAETSQVRLLNVKAEVPREGASPINTLRSANSAKSSRLHAAAPQATRVAASATTPSDSKASGSTASSSRAKLVDQDWIWLHSNTEPAKLVKPKHSSLLQKSAQHKPSQVIAQVSHETASQVRQTGRIKAGKDGRTLKLVQHEEEPEQLPMRLELAPPEQAVMAQVQGPAVEEIAAPEQLPPIDPTKREIMLQSARNAVSLKNLDQAAERYEALLSLAPKDLAARLEYAGVLTQLERNEEAIQSYRQVLQLDSNNTQAASSLVTLLEAQGNLEEAAIVVEEQLQKNPEDQQAAIRLATLLLQTRNRAQAIEIYLRYVDIEKLDNENRTALASLLYSLNDPAGAIQVLIPLMESGLLEADTLKIALQSYAVVGEFESLRTLVSHHIQSDPSYAEPIIEVAEDFLDQERYPAALNTLEETTRFLTFDPEIMTLLVRAKIGEYQLVSAMQMLEEQDKAIPPWERSLLIGTIMLKSGNYLEALADFEEVLSMEPNNKRAIFGKSDALKELGQADIAEGLLTHYCAMAPEDMGAKFRLAQLYVDQRRFGMAESIYSEIVALEPGIVYTYEAYVSMLTKQKRHQEALDLIAELRMTRSVEIMLVSSMRLEQAYVLHKKRQQVQSMELVRNFEPASKLQIPRKYLLLYQSAWASGDQIVTQTARQHLVNACMPSLSLSVETANRALDECLPIIATEILDQARSNSGDELAMIVRTAEAYAAQNTEQAFFVAEEMFRSVLAISPTNARAHIGLARLLTTMGRYHEAEEVYCQLTSRMPNFVTAQREEARLIRGHRGRVAGDWQYQELLSRSPQPMPHAPGVLTTSPALSMSAMSFDQPDLTGAISIERQAKSLKDWRPAKAIHKYKELVAVEPSNENAYFDLGQQYSARKRTHAALGAYSELLCVDPCNHAANIAIKGTRRKLEPRGTFDFTYFQQDGRNGLANIKRLGFEWGAEIPLGDEDEFLRLDYQHMIYEGDNSQAVLGSAFGGEYHGRFWHDFSYFIDADVSVFDDGGFSSRPNFDAGVGMDTDYDGYIELGGFLQNVAENDEAMAQDIFQGGGRILGRVKPTSRWQMESLYRFAGYSDSNFRHNFLVHNRVQLMEVPNELHFLADYDFLSFYEGTTFGPGPGIAGSIHPYFAPQGFSNASLGFEYKRHLGRYHFNGAQEKWVALQYRAQWDSRGEFYNLAAARAFVDITGRLSAGIDTSLTRSDVYDNDLVHAYMVVFFP